MSEQPTTLSITDRELFYRLGWFTHVRWAMAALAILALLVSWYVLGVRFRTGDGPPTMAPAVKVVLAVLLYNAVFTFLVHILHARGQIDRRLIVQLAMGQLVCDMIAACALAHYTGGVENFFTILVLVPLVIATELLPRRLTYATAAGAVMLINALAWGEQQGLIEHVQADWPNKAAVMYTDPLFVLKVTAALTITIFAIVFVAAAISSKLRNREAELERAYTALSRADEAKSFFMRKAGHEMRAPLSAIYSILGAITDTCKTLGSEPSAMVDRAQKRMRGLMELVDDLRDYSRLRAGGSLLRVRRIEMGELVRETVELFRERARDAGVELTCTAGPARLAGDKELLNEVVTNLVSNAIQYTPSGGRVEVRLSSDDHETVLSVSDTGIGIAPQATERIFEEFYRSGAARRMLPEGTGLGLAITRRIVELHGGRIEFASAAGGTTFTVYLPLAGGPGPSQAG
ncbi:MAG TPA: HAMP domain-containing sensor histidine kinase [Phycisphaerae bacterium]|nr:HAMP domain-containing sensor histidine kinase [Phycisphaerae bacterium]HUT60904.1 HAMP domain-containing sensor histidine kinase [Phycisphaerae bacterium]